MAVNDIQKTVIVGKVKKYFSGNVKGKKIALWGLAFKPDTDDIREAPSLYIIDELLKAGAHISAYDPEAAENVKKLLADKISYSADPYEALKDADALLIATEWSVFRTPEFDRMAALMKQKIIFDGRNLYEPSRMKELGFYYNSMGREVVAS
jgi:UDPglucose 6-dehydrogenase